MMISVTQTDDLTFSVKFDPAMIDVLRYMSSWSTPAQTLQCILCDTVLGPSLGGDFGDLDDDNPF